MKKHLESSAKTMAINAVLKQGESVTKVAKIFAIHRSNLYRWIEVFQKDKDIKRKTNPLSGQQYKLCGENSQNVLKILLKPATKYGYDTDFWTTRRIVQVVKKELKIEISRMAVYRTLIKYKQSYKTPEKRYYEADIEEQKIWQQKVVPLINKTVKKHKAILYFEDESNISLTPTIAKTWSPRGVSIKKVLTGNRGSVSAISAISNDGRLLFNVHDGDKRYSGSDIVAFLKNMLIHHPKRHLVVVMDQAPCHRGALVKDFVLESKRLHVFYLPPRSPAFNPDEKVWHHLKNQELKSHQARSTKELKILTKSKLKKISGNKRTVKGIFRMSEIASSFDAKCRD